MSSKKPIPSQATAEKNTRSKSVPEEPASPIRGVRESVEALVIALVLAFFFKAFAAEAFVIPTGSMATTLMGRHKDVCCEMCNYPFQISASEESNDGSEQPSDIDELPKVLAGTCPQCRFTMYVGADNLEKKTFLSYNGDRIFVNKSQFDFADPKRWHVTVFRYPGRAQMNYIKRLVGEENETVRLQNGDVFVKKDGEEHFQIQRKPLRALLAMLRPVDDNDYVLANLHETTDWPTRWFTEDGASWIRSEDYKSFHVDDSGNTGTISWLKYRHIVPSSDDWYYLMQNMMPPQGVVNNPQLVTDFVGYNSGIVRPAPYRGYDPDKLITTLEILKDGERQKAHYCRKNSIGSGVNWVGDLAISCRLTVEKAQGQAVFRLVKGATEFLCSIDLSSGDATFSIPGVAEFPETTSPTPIRAGASFDVLFCNIDEELRLIVDGKEIDFGLEGRYDVLCESGGPVARDRAPDRKDLEPVGIGVSDAAVKVEHLKIQRDMYYIACDENSQDRQCDLLYLPIRSGQSITENTLANLLSTPDYWIDFGKTHSVTFEMGKGQYLMLGDNSAKSKDSRLWTSDGIPHYVPRDLLIGEAVFVYWPHGLRIPGTRIALIPSFSKFRFID